MSDKEIRKQATSYLQILLSIMLFTLIVIDAFLPDWELDLKAYIILGAGTLGARPETVADWLSGFFGTRKNDKT